MGEMETESVRVSVKEFYELKETVKLIDQSMKNRNELDKLRDEQLTNQLNNMNTQMQAQLNAITKTLEEQAKKYQALANEPLKQHREDSQTVRKWLITGGLTFLFGLLGLGVVQYINGNVTKYDSQLAELQKVIEAQQKTIEHLKTVGGAPID